MKAFLAVLALATAAAISPNVRAQSGGPYSLSWSTIDGGGGVSSGGAFTLAGTIGQPDAGGPLVGGNYTLVGGFWSIVSAIQTPGAPLLTVARNSVSGAVTISWPSPSEGWVLDQTGTLATPPASIVWAQVGFPYQTNAGQISVTVPAPAGNRFYRLRRP